jgi:hypothetical protein
MEIWKLKFMNKSKRHKELTKESSKEIENQDNRKKMSNQLKLNKLPNFSNNQLPPNRKSQLLRRREKAEEEAQEKANNEFIDSLSHYLYIFYKYLLLLVNNTV